MMAPSARLRNFAGLLSLFVLLFAVSVCSAGRPEELGGVAGFEGGPPLTDGKARDSTLGDAGDGGGDAADATVVATDASEAGDAASDAAAEAETGPEPATISWASIKCNGTPCSIMGLKTSGFNEQAIVGFKVVDSNGMPVPGVPMSFRSDNAPSGTTTTTSGFTDANGIASATVQSGTSVGSFIIKASIVVEAGLLEVDSPTIGVRGAKPSNRGFNFSCTTVNIAAYSSPAPPRIMSVACNVRLVDRFNNPVGTGTTVNFKSEAGAIPASTPSKLYDPGSTNTEEGTAGVTFTTQGTFPPAATTPLVADTAQYPSGRPLEPSHQVGLVLRNPRDGLVTLIAYTRGEEFFDDNNNNGTWDTGERFIDEGEPFVDSNDNGVWDAGEVYVDESGDGLWNGPNGTWDINKNIWTEARILYTSAPSSALTASSWTTPSITVPRATYVHNTFTLRDPNLNVLSSEFSLGAGKLGKGSVEAFAPTALFDGFGMTIERPLVDATTQLECTSTTARCKFRTVFTSFQSGPNGSVTFKGADLTNTDPAFSGTFNVLVNGSSVLPLSITVP
jgi:hypothetical protein